MFALYHYALRIWNDCAVLLIFFPD